MKRLKCIGTFLLLLVLTCCAAACSTAEEKGPAADVTITVKESGLSEPTPESVSALADMVDKIPVVLYFADEQGNLVAEKRDIPKVDGIARMTINELTKGPGEDSALLPTIPPGAQLKDINITDGLCTVDFNGALKENHPGGSSGELLTVYSIVNTLTQFPTIERVQILVDGQTINTLAGHLDLSVPLERHNDIVVSGASVK